MFILIGVAFFVLPILLFLYACGTQFTTSENSEEEEDIISDGRLLQIVPDEEDPEAEDDGITIPLIRVSVLKNN